MRQPSPEDPLWNLIDAVCSDSIDSEQVRELEERLANDTAAKSLFADYCLMHAEIRFHVSAQGVVNAAREEIEALGSAGPSLVRGDQSNGDSGVHPSERLRRPVLFGIRGGGPQLAALVLLGALVLFAVSQWSQRKERTTEVSNRPNVRTDADKLRELVDRRALQESAVEIDGFAGQLSGTFQAKWDEATTAPFVRQYLHLNERLQLRDGMAEVSLYGGTKLILEGPCRFTINSTSAGTLERGRILVGNSARTAGFQVKTPRAIVIDLGGEFGVEVDESGDAHVHVLDGVVQVAFIDDKKLPAKSIHLVTNESLSIRAKDSVATKGVADVQRFARVIPQSNDRLDQLLRGSLIGHFVFDDPQNLGRNTGIGRDATVQFGPTATPSAPALGQAIDLGGDDQRSIDIAAEDVSMFSPGGSGGTGLTVAAWVKTTCIDQRGNVFFAYNAVGENADTHRDIVLMELEYGGLPNALVRDEDFGREINLVHHQGIADGKWHHVAITLSAGTEKTLNLYVDGELSGTKSSRLINDVVLRRARAGRRLCERAEDDNDFQGLIDELLILNRTLKPSELRWLFNATRPNWS